MDKILFNCSSGLRLSADQVVREIIGFMKADNKKRYRITIGTDSELLSDKQADFVTAIVVYRIGNGGRYFWRQFKTGKFHTLRDRIIKEVVTSLDVAKELLGILKTMEVDFDFEIHADIGEGGPSKDMIQEVVGMIRAYNFEAITKPGSYAASNVADRHI